MKYKLYIGRTSGKTQELKKSAYKKLKKLYKNKKIDKQTFIKYKEWLGEK